MPKIRLIAYVSGTILTALGMGFFVQYGESTPTAPKPVSKPPVQQSILKPTGPVETAETGALDLQDIQHTSATRNTPQRPANPAEGDFVLATAQQDEMAAPLAAQAQTAPQPACDVDLTATPADMATVDLQIAAPCMGSERVTIHHNGMMFTDLTDSSGSLSVNVPALAKTAVFIVQFSNGNGSVVVTTAPELDDYDRVVLQWSGPTGLQIHAREFGASYGEQGHVWSGAATGGKGRVTMLGNAEALAPQLAEIYTFPSGQSQQSGDVALSIEVEVTAQTCGKEISAQTLEFRSQAELRTRDLDLSMPDCSAVGDFLVLNNLVDDLTIAAR